jgi:hypothetical protein
MSNDFAIEMVMYSCRERDSTRAATLRSLGQSDLCLTDLAVLLDPETGPPSPQRMAAQFVRAMAWAAKRKSDFVLMLEDDLIVNSHTLHNLQAWLRTFRPRDVGSLYRTGIARSIGNQAIIARPSQWSALHIEAAKLNPQQLQPFDVWLRQQIDATRFRVHSPSLVQHNSHRSTCGHINHRARNFNAEFRAP